MFIVPFEEIMNKTTILSFPKYKEIEMMKSDMIHQLK